MRAHIAKMMMLILASLFFVSFFPFFFDFEDLFFRRLNSILLWSKMNIKKVVTKRREEERFEKQQLPFLIPIRCDRKDHNIATRRVIFFLRLQKESRYERIDSIPASEASDERINRLVLVVLYSFTCTMMSGSILV